MLSKVLTYFTERLNEYLAARHNQPEGVAEVGVIGSSSGERENKMVVSLLNIERESAGGIAPTLHRHSGGTMVTAPQILLNINIMLAAEYDDKHYAKSLAVLSNTLLFIQGLPKFDFQGVSYTVELVPLSTNDLHNIWTTMGGHYFPSVVCKIRRLTIDSGEIISTSRNITKQH